MDNFLIAILALGLGFCVGVMFTAATMLRLYNVTDKQKGEE